MWIWLPVRLDPDQLAGDDIRTRVEATQSEIHAAVTGVRRLAKFVSSIDQTQQSIATAVEEQTATTSEVGRNVVEAANGNKAVAAGVAEVAVAAKTTSRPQENWPGYRPSWMAW